MQCHHYLLMGIFCLLHVDVAHAFYDWQGEQSQGNARAALRGLAIATRKPANLTLYEERDDEAVGGIARLIVESRVGDGWLIDANLYQTWLPNSLVANENGIGTVLDVERSGTLEWSHSQDHYAHSAVDRLSLRKSIGALDLSLGRQPINLATTFFFSPNDFFAPFAAQAFYRVYKPGVDGLRSDLSFGELTQLSLIGVQGYREDSASDSGWSDSGERARNSYVARFATNLADMEWAVLAGKVRRTRVTGGSIAGELFAGLGLRTEGHVVQALDENIEDASELSIGFEYRWENSLFLQVEQFYHGRGANSVAEYATALGNEGGYLARRYQALGLSYEFSPLLTGQMNIIQNAIDHSRLYSFNTVYSLSNESELSLSLTLPEGESPEGLKVNSEFGSYPKVVNLELRAYF